MKKYILLMTVLILSFVFVKAQNEIAIKGTKKINQKLTPQQVIDSLHKRFPDAKSVKYYQVPPDAAKGWAVTTEDNLDPGAEVDYYTISFNSQGVKYYGLYDKDGHLVKAKIQENVDNLPEPVRASLKDLSQKYPGYKMVSKTYYKNQNYDKSKEHYEIVAKKGSDEMRLFYDAAGNLIKIKE